MFNNKPVIACPKCLITDCNNPRHDLVKFDSTGEYERFKALSKSKHITFLKLKPEYSLYAARPVMWLFCVRRYIGKMTPDYVYFDRRERKKVIEDYKGGADPTPEFKYRWKILQANQPDVVFRISNKAEDFLE